MTFKGDSSAPKKKKSAKRPIESLSSSSEHKGNEPKEELSYEAMMQNGIGRISSSGMTIQGQYTEFMNQLSPGDAIIITHPTSLQEETKIVRMVLSNTSMGISSNFSTDLISTCTFKYIKAPKDEVTEEEVTTREVSKKHKAEEDAFGTYASKGGTQLTYRVKTGSAFGGYKIITETTTDKSREDLLQMRSKKKSDRFCNV